MEQPGGYMPTSGIIERHSRRDWRSVLWIAVRSRLRTALSNAELKDACPSPELPNF
jgi:hypothetical protein